MPFFPTGQIITTGKRNLQVFGEVKNWPPENWFVSFDYFSTQATPQNSYLDHIIWLQKKGANSNSPGFRIVHFERKKNSLKLKVYTETNGALCYPGLGFAANTFVQIRFQQKRETNGRLMIKLQIAGQEKCSFENTAAVHNTYEVVQILFEGYNLPNEPKVIIKNFEFGKLN